MSSEIEIKLQKLKDALDAGVLTAEEYDKKVNDVINSGATTTENQEGLTEEIPKEVPTEELEDDGVVYFNANDKAQAGAGRDQNVFSYQNPKAAVGKKKKGKKKWIIIGGIVLVLILFGAIGSCGGGDVSEETYDWPADNEIAQMLPTPEGEITYISIDDEEGMENLSADVTISGGEACKAYIDACKEKGFTEKKESSISDGDYEYTAQNEDGWVVDVYNFDEDMYIYLYSPGYYKEINSDEEETEATEAEESDADFRQTMDDYEAFMDEYIEFMENYENGDSSAKMLADYADMMTKYSEFADEIDAIDEDSLSDSDYDYYIEVTTRVANKLAKASLD